jgi:predicted dehydrogenase
MEPATASSRHLLTTFCILIRWSNAFAPWFALGLLGHLTQVQVNYRNPINTADGRTWKYRKDAMGDAIGIGIIRALSVMAWIFEADQQCQVAVYATSEAARERPFECDPIWNILVRFSGGGTGFCFGNIEWGNGYDVYHIPRCFSRR